MDQLNSDIVSEILTCNAKEFAKSASQCIRVCKFWPSIMGKSNTGMLFVNRTGGYCCDINFYYRERSSEMVNLTQEQTFRNIVTKIGSLGVVSGFRLVGSCNGLLCYRTHTDDVMYITNPIIGERIRLPMTGIHNQCRMGTFYHCGGFGYCHSNDRYTVVRISKTRKQRELFQVYTLGNGSRWRNIPNFTYSFEDSGVYANGDLHWLNYKKPERRLNGKSNIDIVAFDLTDETFRSLPSPSCRVPSDLYRYIKLGSLGDSLYLCLPYRKKGECMMDIWVFQNKNLNNCGSSSCIKDEDYYNSFIWIKKFSRKWDSEFNTKCHLLSLTKNEILLWQHEVLSCYDPKDTASKKQWYAKSPEGISEAIPHMNSLVSLKDLGEELVHR